MIRSILYRVLFIFLIYCPKLSGSDLCLNLEEKKLFAMLELDYVDLNIANNADPNILNIESRYHKVIAHAGLYHRRLLNKYNENFANNCVYAHLFSFLQVFALPVMMADFGLRNYRSFTEVIIVPMLLSFFAYTYFANKFSHLEHHIQEQERKVRAHPFFLPMN